MASIAEHGHGVEAEHRLCWEYYMDFKVRRRTVRSNLLRHRFGEDEHNSLSVGT